MSNVKKGDRVRIVVEGPVTDVLETDSGTAIAVDGFEYYPDFEPAHVMSVEILEPPRPQWVQGDVVVINPEKPFSFVLVRQADRWVCSKESDRQPHDHDDDQVNSFLDNGRATALIAGGKVVTPE